MINNNRPKFALHYFLISQDRMNNLCFKISENRIKIPILVVLFKEDNTKKDKKKKNDCVKCLNCLNIQKLLILKVRRKGWACLYYHSPGLSLMGKLDSA